MLRQNRSIEGLMKGPCKIRKRGCSSSSSTSSVLHNYRFKRAILVRKRGGSSTPVPTWKMSSRSPYSTVGIAESPKYPPSRSGCAKGKQAPVSARKLAATLWEMNELPSPSMKQVLEEKRSKKELRSRGRDRIPRSVNSGSLPPHLSDPSHSPPSERMDRSVTGSIHRRTPAISQRHRLTDHNGRGFDSLTTASLMEIDMRSRGRTPTGSITGVKSRLKDLSNGLTASKELLKILNRFWDLEEQHSSSVSIISALHVELEQAHLQVDQLIREQRSEKREIDYFMKRLAEEKTAWRSKDKERIQVAVETIAGDLEVEKKLRRRSESLNKKLGIELAETKAAFSKVVEELESEKKARKIMEEICDELARGIGEDKAKVEELKRESAKVREEVEKEREMLQLADLLREERLQMKLSEAKYQFEEKNAAVDKLRDELEAFLKTERTKENQNVSQNFGTKGELLIRSHLGKTPLASNQNEETGDNGEVEEGEGRKEVEPEEDDSAESDLHSIELNMDITSRNYRLNYTAGLAQEDPKRGSVEEENKGRKSTSEKTRRGSVSLERSISDGIDWYLNSKSLLNWGDAKDHGRFAELDKQNQGQDYDDELQGYKSIKGLRDHILSGSQMASARCFPSPTRQWGQPRPSRDSGNAGGERATAVRESSLKARQVETRGEVRSSRHSRK